jgi:hypothetical protein
MQKPILIAANKLASSPRLCFFFIKNTYTLSDPMKVSKIKPVIS